MVEKRTEPGTPYQKWVVMTTYSIGHAVATMSAMVLGILLPSMTEEMGLSPAEQGWLGSSAVIGSLVASLPFGWWLSRYNPKMTTTITFVVGSVLVFLQGWAPTFAMLLAGRIVFGLTLVARDPPRALLVRQWLRGREVVLYFGLLNAIFGLSLSLAFVVTPFLLDAFGDDWRKTTYTLAGLNVALTAAWVLLGKEGKADDGSEDAQSDAGPPIQGLFKYREPWLVGIGMVGYAFAQMAQITFWPTFMQETFDMSLVVSGFLIGILGVVVATGGLVIVPVMSRTKGNRLPLIVLGLGMTGTYMGLLFSDFIPLLILMFFVNGIFRGAFWTIFSSVPFELPGSTPRESAVFQSMMMTMFWGGGVLGPLTVGFIQDTTADLEAALIVSSLFPLLITFAAMFLPRRRPAAVVEAKSGAG